MVRGSSPLQQILLDFFKEKTKVGAAIDQWIRP